MTKRRHKYNARKVTIDGHTFDSLAEADYYKYLKFLKSTGSIRFIELQPILELIPKFSYMGANRQKSTYVLDFRIIWEDGSEEYIDVKGTTTPLGNYKRKHAEYLYPDKKITWIVRDREFGNEFGWADFEYVKKERARLRRELLKKRRQNK